MIGAEPKRRADNLLLFAGGPRIVFVILVEFDLDGTWDESEDFVIDAFLMLRNHFGK